MVAKAVLVTQTGGLSMMLVLLQPLCLSWTSKVGCDSYRQRPPGLLAHSCRTALDSLAWSAVHAATAFKGCARRAPGAAPAGPCPAAAGTIYDLQELLLAGTAAVVRINAPGEVSGRLVAAFECVLLAVIGSHCVWLPECLLNACCCRVRWWCSVCRQGCGCCRQAWACSTHGAPARELRACCALSSSGGRRSGLQRSL